MDRVQDPLVLDGHVAADELLEAAAEPVDVARVPRGDRRLQSPRDLVLHLRREKFDISADSAKYQ